MKEWNISGTKSRLIIVALICLVSALAFVTPVTAAGISNGGFEDGLASWSSSGWGIGNGDCKHSGVTSAELYGSYNGNALIQAFSADEPGAITFWYSRHSLTSGSLIVYLDNAEVWRVDGKGSGSPVWSEGSVYCPTAGSHTIMFVVDGSNYYTNLDDVTFDGGSTLTPTPTPTPTPTSTSVPAPVASFTAIPLTGNQPLTVQFTDTSTGSPTTWSWDFGNGGTSAEQNPQYTYANAGTYTIRLTVANDGGSDTMEKAGYVTVTPVTVTGIINGGFEDGMVPWTTSYWRIGNGDCKHSGATSAEIYGGASGGNYISQTFTVDEPGAIRFWYARHSLTTGSLVVSVDGSEAWRIDSQGTGSDSWFEGSVYCPTAGTHTISFTVQGTNWYTSLDDVTFDGGTGPTPTPTPTPTLHFIAEPVGEYHWNHGYQENEPRMNSNYTVFINVKNPNDIPLPLSLTMDEIPVNEGFEEKYKPPYNPPKTVNKIVGAGDTESFEFKFRHQWSWMEGLKQKCTIVLEPAFEKIDDIAMVVEIVNELNKAKEVDPEFISYSEWVEKFNKYLGYAEISERLISAGLGQHSAEYKYSPQATNVDGLTIKPVIISVGYEKVTSFGMAITTSHLAGWTTVTGAAAFETVFGSAALFIAEGSLMWGTSMFDQMAYDPDHNYMDPINVAPETMPELDQIPETPLKDFARQSVPIVPHSTALMQTYSKYLGAEEVDDEIWETKLLKDCYRYSSLLEDDYRSLNSTAGAAIQYLEKQGFNPSAEDISEVKTDLQTNGLPEVEVQILRRWGLSDQEINSARNMSILIPDSAIIHYNQSLYYLIGKSEEQTTLLNKQFATELGSDAPPYADFTSSTTSGKAPLAIQFTDTSLRSPNQWVWNFGDGATATTQNAQHTYTTAGTYTVILTATNSITGSDTRTKYDLITVTAPTPPIANFTATPTSGKAPLAVQFTDTSLNTPIGWSWDFGDGTNSTEQNPAHAYMVIGNHTVSLTATNGDGSNTRTVTDLITVIANPPIANFTATPTSGKSPLSVQFTDQSAGQVTSWSWNFGDGSTSAQQNVTHTYTAPGTYTVKLTASGPGGSNTMEKTGYIKVISSSSLTADFTGSPLQGMDPFNVHFADKSTGKVTLWKWNFGDGETSTHQNPTHRYEKPGLYTVTLTVSGPGGSDTLTRTDYILVTESVKKPVARFETEPMMGRVPLNVQFTDKSMHNPSSYQWDFDDGTHSTLQNPGHTFNRPGIYRTRLTVSNSAGSDSTWRVVIAFPRQWWWW